MGVAKTNISGGIDFATGKYYIEFHRKLIISKDSLNLIINYLGEDKVDEAADLLKKETPEDAHGIIEVVLKDLKPFSEKTDN